MAHSRDRRGIRSEERGKLMDEIRDALGPDAHHVFFGGKPPARRELQYVQFSLDSVVRFYVKRGMKPEWAEAEWYVDPVKGVVIFRVLGPADKPPDEAEKGAKGE